MQATEVNSPPVGLRADERPGGWLFFPRQAPLDPRTQAIYQQMLEHLQRDMLVLLIALGCVAALFTGASLAHSIWILHVLPPAMFAVQVARVGLIVGLVIFFLRRGQIGLAWYG